MVGCGFKGLKGGKRGEFLRYIGGFFNEFLILGGFVG